MASFKNAALREAGAYVPKSYADFGNLIEQVFDSLSKTGSRNNTEPSIEISQKLAMINNRKLTKFTSTISDER